MSSERHRAIGRVLLFHLSDVYTCCSGQHDNKIQRCQSQENVFPRPVAVLGDASWP